MSSFILESTSEKGWIPVSAPVGWTWTLPFGIEQRGRKFRPEPNFNLRTHAAITVSKTYWLNTVTGSDANPGTELLPKATWNAIIALGDYDRIIIQNGSYLLRSVSTSLPARSVEIIGEGTVYFTSDRVNNLGAWSLAAAQTFTFQSTVSGGNFISRVFDEGTLDALGLPTVYAIKTSIAQVEAQPGSMYWVGGVLYVHTLDGLTPSGRTDLRYYDSLAFAPQVDSLSLYFENIQFRGGVRCRNNSAAGGLKVYFSNCTGTSLEIAGVDETILQNCRIFLAAGDGINYDVRNTINCDAIEIDCEVYDLGLATDNQASSGHTGSEIVRINGVYHHTAGQCIADVLNTGKTWMLGTRVHHSATGVGFYSGVNMWLDCCFSHDNATDIQNEAGETVFIRRFIGTGVNSIAGTLAAY